MAVLLSICLEKTLGYLIFINKCYTMYQQNGLLSLIKLSGVLYAAFLRNGLGYTNFFHIVKNDVKT